jgi:hypothetical protein
MPKYFKIVKMLDGADTANLATRTASSWPTLAAGEELARPQGRAAGFTLERADRLGTLVLPEQPRPALSAKLS